MGKYIFSEESRSVLEHLRQPFAVYQFIDKRVVTLLLSDGFCELFGYENRSDAVYDMDNDMYKDTHPDDIARIANAALQFATESGRYEVVYRTRKKNSAEYTVIHALGEHVYTDDGARLAQVWYTDEGTYTEDSALTGDELNKALNKELRNQSVIKTNSYDYLTGLPNMTYFFELAEASKNAIQQYGIEPVLLYIDLGGMKFFNVRHGFEEGNKMLQAFAKLLIKAFSNENCCRIGADHFAAITEKTGLENKLNSIFQTFGELYSGKTPPIHVGIYAYHTENVPVSAACDRAKLACVSLKGTYTSAFSYYSDELREEALQKQYVIENIDTAIREKWIQVYLQPIVRIVNNRVCDVEALARWYDPERGVLSPASFIPVLEESGQIYKLDLYMLDKVLESMQKQKANGLDVIPHSINLSRSDFNACDIVEEIRRRVDEAGVSRDRITIEITESIIGSNFDFMKEQVDRFRALGFQVWMDDFGSGYSSLDVLQSIRFDLIKFDMSFMQKLDEGSDGKAILTELMRLATSLGLETVCEGVETEEQVQFLREIGCSKAQGYYYGKPIPFNDILEMHKTDSLSLDNENPAESKYYESIGKTNLFDLGVIAGEENDTLQSTFSNIPIAVLEVKGSEARYIRSNRSYQQMIKRLYNGNVLTQTVNISETSSGYGSEFIAAIRHCCESGNSVFFDEMIPDGSVLHSFVRKISTNPVSGWVAIVAAVLSISEPTDKTTYADIARSLAADYYNIYVIDLNTESFTEYSSRVGGEELSVERYGEHFFASAREAAETRIYEEDREPFLKWFTKENVLNELNAHDVFTLTYRLIDTGEPVYVHMKITRLRGGSRIILGISIIDAQMKQQEEEKRLRQEKISLGRIAALSTNYIVLYTVDPVTGQYTQYSPSAEFKSMKLAMQGEDFFRDVVLDAPKAIAPEDMERHLRVLTKENMLREIHMNGIFVHNYGLLMDGKTVPVSLRAALIKEDDGEKIILGVSKL